MIFLTFNCHCETYAKSQLTRKIFVEMWRNSSLEIINFVCKSFYSLPNYNFFLQIQKQFSVFFQADITTFGNAVINLLKTLYWEFVSLISKTRCLFCWWEFRSNIGGFVVFCLTRCPANESFFLLFVHLTTSCISNFPTWFRLFVELFYSKYLF